VPLMCFSIEYSNKNIFDKNVFKIDAKFRLYNYIKIGGNENE